MLHGCLETDWEVAQLYKARVDGIMSFGRVWFFYVPQSRSVGGEGATVALDPAWLMCLFENILDRVAFDFPECVTGPIELSVISRMERK